MEIHLVESTFALIIIKINFLKINAPTITMKASLIHNIVFKELLNLYKSILSIPAFLMSFILTI